VEEKPGVAISPPPKFIKPIYGVPALYKRSESPRIPDEGTHGD